MEVSKKWWFGQKKSIQTWNFANAVLKSFRPLCKAKILTNRDENVEESDEQIFTIIGNRRQIQTAQFLITFCQNLPQSVDFEDFDYCPETGRMLYQRGLYHGIKETIAWKLIVGNDTKIINLSSLVWINEIISSSKNNNLK